jgi:hypothetical protein
MSNSHSEAGSFTKFLGIVILCFASAIASIGAIATGFYVTYRIVTAIGAS